MTANTARIALTLSLTLALAACGGGGGGGGGADDDGNSSGAPPAGFGDFDGSFTLRGTNPPGASFATTFDDSFPADFMDGEAIVGVPPNDLATEFDYPLDAQDGGCYYKRGAIDHCVERAEGKVLALCTSPSADDINSIGISVLRNNSFNTASVAELQGAADARAGNELELRSLNCANDLDANDTVTMLVDGTVVQRFGNQQESLTPAIVNQLFTNAGRSVGTPETARVGAKAFKHTVGGTVTYYVVTFGAENAQGTALPPKVFVSAN